MTAKGFFEEYGYAFTHSKDDKVNPKNYKLHNHYGSYEVYMFLKGDADFIIEGSVYPMGKYDIFLLNPNEFHNVSHHNDGEYERVVLQIDNKFFTKNDCDNLRRIFDARKIGTQNIIPASFVLENNILEIIERIEKYSNEEGGKIAVKCGILELLYVLNKYKHKEEISSNNEKITPIIMYINENITMPLTVDMIAEKFFINKYYLCRLFKKHTGLTINKYITYKRIILVKNLCNEGKTISQASTEAGFGNYSNFYKMYVKDVGKSPKQDLKNI